MNPVLLKDLIGLLRLKRVAAIQVFFLLVLGVLVMLTWPQSGVLTGTFGAGSAEAAEVASAARGQDQLLLSLVLGQIVLLLLFVPGIASVALTSEKEANTLEMLYASRLSPAEIIWGKVGFAIAFPLLLLLTALPFVALLYFRGDVRPSDLLWSYVLLFVTAVMLAMVCLMISALCKQSSTALVVSYIAVLVMCGAVLVPAAIMLASQGGLVAQLLHYIRSLSPVAAALALLAPDQFDFSGRSRESLMSLWTVFLPAAISVTIICFCVLVAKLRTAPNAAEGFGHGARDAQHSKLRRVLYLIDPKKTPKPFGRLNPVISKERRTSQLRSGRWMIRIFYASLLISLLLSAMALYGGDMHHANLLNYVAAIVVMFQVGLVALVSPSLTSSTVSTELETGTWEILRLTPLSGWSIFWGKFLPAFMPALLPIIALLPAYGALWYIQQEYLQYFLNIIPIVVLATAFCCTLGLMCSTLFASTARATVTAYVVTAAIFVLPMIAWWASGVVLSERVAAHIAFVSPVVVAVNQLKEAWPAIAEYRLYSKHLYLMGGMTVATLIVAWLRLAVLMRRG